MTARAQPRSSPTARTSLRGEPVIRRVLEAAVQELGRVGYAALRVEEVAARAQINKSSVYRRWPTKESLVRAALLSVAACDDESSMPNTGSVRDDLLAAARGVVEIGRSPEGRMLMQVLAAEQPDSELSIIARSIRESRAVVPRMILERAKERGELRPEVDPTLFFDILRATCTNAIIGSKGINEGFVARVIDLLLTGALSARARARDKQAAAHVRDAKSGQGRRDDA